jgi:hypothetical protein
MADVVARIIAREPRLRSGDATSPARLMPVAFLVWQVASPCGACESHTTMSSGAPGHFAHAAFLQSER